MEKGKLQEGITDPKITRYAEKAFAEANKDLVEIFPDWKPECVDDNVVIISAEETGVDRYEYGVRVLVRRGKYEEVPILLIPEGEPSVSAQSAIAFAKRIIQTIKRAKIIIQQGGG